MTTLKDVERLANELLNKTFTINTYWGDKQVNAKQLGYTFKFDYAKRRFGCCNYKYKTISLSKPLCEINLHQLEGKITDTILHELAHAFCVEIYGRKDGRGHDHKWQSIALQIGSDGKRCFNHSDFGGIEKPNSKYTLVCNTCGHEASMHRQPKYARSCGKCAPNRYDEEFKMVLRQNY